jgi:hypothetical protein
MLREIKGHFENNEELNDIFGGFVGNGKWDSSCIEVAGRVVARKEPTVNTIGVAGSAASKHYDGIFADDLVDEPNSLTPLQRKRLEDWVYKVLDPCLLPPDDAIPERGEIHYKGTRYADTDLYGHLTENEMKGDRTAVLPLKGPDGHSVWPERFSDDWIREKELAMGSIRFGSQMMLSTAAMKGKIFRFDDCLQHDPSEYPDRSEMLTYVGIDLATGEGEDRFACVVIGRSPKRWQHIWVWEFYEGVISYGDQRTKTVQFGRRYKPRRTGVEANGYQKVEFAKLRKDHEWLHVRPVSTESSKTVRGHRLQGRFESHQVHFIRGEHHDLIQHLIDFDGKPGGRDDLFDALDIAITISERRGSEQVEEREEPGVI